MKLMVISQFIIVLAFYLLIPLVSAFEFELVSPETANFNESFSVSINSASTGTYDVKIFVYKDLKEFSEIYNGSSWLAPRKYLIAYYPQIKSFQLKAYYIGNTEVCARLKKTNSSFKEVCNPIKINSASGSQNISPNEVMNSSESDSPQENITASSDQPDFVPSQNNSSSAASPITTSNNEASSAGRVILNSKPADTTYTTKTETVRSAMIYSFLFLCIVIIIFLALRKL